VKAMHRGMVDFS